MNINFEGTLETLAKEIHAFNVDKGWWDDYPVKTDRFDTAMMLVTSELSESMEGCRKNLMDDKVPQYRMFDVELADAMIRLLDLAGAYEIETFGRSSAVDTEPLIDSTQPEQLWHIVKMLGYTTVMRSESSAIHFGVLLVQAVANHNDIDLKSIIKAKMEFNNVRPDHLRENRAKENGKKF